MLSISFPYFLLKSNKKGYPRWCNLTRTNILLLSSDVFYYLIHIIGFRTLSVFAIC